MTDRTIRYLVAVDDRNGNLITGIYVEATSKREATEKVRAYLNATILSATPRPKP
jgi:hypothetical protein